MDGNCDSSGLKPLFYNSPKYFHAKKCVITLSMKEFLFCYTSETLFSLCASSAGSAPDGAPPLPAHPGQGDPEWECHHPKGLALRSPPVLQIFQWYERKK